MKKKFIIISIILSIVSTQYAIQAKGMSSGSPGLKNESQQPKTQVKSAPTAKLLYNDQLKKLQDPSNTINKNKSILRALTGTASYKDVNNPGGTIVLNKITNTITFKDADGNSTRQLTKNLNGTTSEVTFDKPFEKDENGKTSIHPASGKPMQDYFNTKTVRTTYKTDNPLGARTVKNEYFTGGININNYNDQNQQTSSKSYHVGSNSAEATVDLYHPTTNQKTSINRDVARAYNIWEPDNEFKDIHNTFKSEMITGLAGDILKYPFTKSTATRGTTSDTTLEKPIEIQ